MTVISWVQTVLYCGIIVALTTPLGGYMTRVFNGEPTFLSAVLRPLEVALYWIGGVDERREQHWLTYTVSMLLFHVGGFLIIYAVLRLQAYLPFNPAGQSAVAEDLSFNTAISFLSHPPSAGTFPTTGALFVGLVIGVILIIGGLTFFPALALGPIVEHLAMLAGTLY